MKSKSGKTMRRISILAALVALICMALAGSVMAETTVVVGEKCYTHGDIDGDENITEDDAIYLLYHSVFGEEEYPLTNYEKEGEITGLDAIALFELKGTQGTKVHAYGLEDNIEWQWESGTAIFKCACGDENQTMTKHATVTSTVQEATCVEPGSITFTATANLTDKAVYTAEKTVEADAATGQHTYNTDVRCVDRTCTVCSHVEEAEAHTYEVVSEKEASCTKAATITYACSVCDGGEYTVENGVAAGHTYGIAKETHVEDCEYKEVYTCSECDSEVEGEHYFKHLETAEITEEATCSHQGTKLYTCSKCNATHETAIAAVADAHTWDDGTTAGTLITYACKEAGCTETKTAINAVEVQKAEVTSEALAETQEIALNGTSLKLDDATAEQLTGDVEIKAETTTAQDLQLDADLQEQIGDNPIYDFSITDATGSVKNFDGSITISLPYELQEGDDVDCIDVWYIDDDGTVTIESGKYANGYVTFTATHFSYYTVTRLTPAQRCEKYDHNDATNVIAATCTEGGYTIKVCARCGRTEKSDATEALGHVPVTTTTDPTCTKAGKTVVTCENCDYKSTSTIPATGHTWEETTETATCEEAKTVYVGCKSCDETKEIVLPRLKHETETTSVAATCDKAPYDKTTCKNCDYEVITYTGSALGHDYDIAWTWDKEAITAKATFTCSRENCENTFDKEATISIEKQLAASCEVDGYVDYLAKVVYNARVYSDGYHVDIPATGHNTTAEWQYNALQHYHECSICESKLEAADHGMDDGVVTKEATCTETGEIVYSCDTCDYQLKETIPAKGHNYDNGVCTVCGFGTEICKHDNFYLVEKEFTTEDGYCGGTFSYETCDCGKVNYFYGYDFKCNFVYNETTVTDENGYVKYNTTATCQDCGLHIEEVASWVIDAEACTGTQYMDMTICDKNDTVLVDFYGINMEDVEHPNVVYGTPDDLKQYGMCDGTATLIECPCGQDGMLIFDSSCEWVEVPDECGEGVYTAICNECGTKQVNEYGPETIGQCRIRFTDTYTFYKDGKELVSYEYSFEMDSHDSDYTFELEGESCSDGYTVHKTCSVCGHEDSYFEQPPVGQHFTYYQIIDVSEYDLCVDEMQVWMCPCEEICNVGNVFEAHDFEGVEWDEKETEDGYIVSGLEECLDCGFTREYTNNVTYTGNGCECEYDYTCKYSVDGKVILSEKQNYTGASHNFEVIGSKLNGNSCEDGAVLTYACSDCDAVDTRTIYYHETFVKGTYDAADYNMCDGQIVVSGCACGEYGWIEDNTDCSWEFVSNDPETGTTKQHCSACGLYREISRTYGEADGCMVPCTEVYEYIDDTTVVLRIDRTYLSENHNFNYTFDIAEGASCDDGFTVNMTCPDCGTTRSWFNQAEEGQHMRYLTETYDMSAYGLCAGYLYLYECPCGESAGMSWEDTGCTWEWYSRDEESGVTTFKCTKCGGTHLLYEVEGEADGCYIEYDVTNVFFNAAGEEKLSVSTKELYGNHDFEIIFDIAEGASCSDGYTVIRTCKECKEVYTSYESVPEGEHRTYSIETYDLADYNFCGGTIDVRECPCGEVTDMSWDVFEYCDFEWVEDAETGEECRECTVCGGQILSTYDWIVVDDCHDYEVETYKFYSPDGTFVTEAERYWYYENHDDICTFEPINGSCENGYTVTMTCQSCKEVRQETGYDHELYTVSKTDLTEYGLCGGSIYHNSCACGEEESTWTSEMCRWQSVGYDDTTMTWTYECPTCQSTKETSTTVSDKDANCMVYQTQNTKLFKADGTLAVEYSQNNNYTSHEYLYDFDMQGTTCEDGYYLIATCEDCNYTSKSPYLYNTHMTWTVENVDLEELGLCGGTVYRSKCACGEYDSWYSYGDECSWSWNSMDGATCTVCGTIRTEQYSDEKIDACHTKQICNCTYTKDGETIFSYVSNSIYEHHDAVYTLTLQNPEGDCMGGYTATGTCRTCNETWTNTGNSHNRYPVATEDLSDDGLCVGTKVTKYACACGAYEHISDEQMETGCNWYYEGATSFSYSWDYVSATDSSYTWEFDVATAQAYRCPSCNAVKLEAEDYGEKEENCQVLVGRVNAYFNNAEEQVYLITSAQKEARHTCEFTGEVVMNDPNDCEAGFYMIYACNDCDYSYQSYCWGHAMQLEERYDLTQYGACAGSYVNKHECYCGENSYIGYDFPNCNLTYTSNDYTDDNGIEHSEYISRCETCDLMFKRDIAYEYDTVNCKVTETETTTITVGDVAVAEPFVQVDTYDYHEFEETAVLADGATSCEDGVIVTNTCKNCGYSYDDHLSWHYEVEAERYDLTEYGSTCGGYAVKSACACGEYEYLSLEDMECDWSRTYVKDELEYDNQYTTEGTNSYWRNEYLRKCAVTDPECGFAIYETDYHVWDEENCEMISYTSWKLGSDDTGSTYETEIVVETGRNTYHAYETTTSADGYTTTETCKYCGSTHVTTLKYDADGNLIYDEESATNKLDNGEPQYRSRLHEYEIYKGYSYETKYYNDMTYANGNEWWIHYDYEFDWDNFDCTATRTMTDSYGNVETNEMEYHKGYWSVVTLEESTCTQYGQERYEKDCPVCEQHIVHDAYETYPNGHYWYDEDGDGVYACIVCGLENINGADGDIIFEDLTTTEGMDYVIGYHKYNQVRFDYELLVVLGEYEIPLDGIVFTEMTKDVDGINAISFNKADAETAAVAALEAAGCTDTTDFALTFVFYPESSDSDFDYAITLTDKSIAE